MVRLVIHQPLRQTEGLLSSLLDLMGVDLPVPDHTTISRRAARRTSAVSTALPVGPITLVIDSTGLKVFGADEWHCDKHGVRGRRTWRQLHLAVDAMTTTIVAATLTTTDDGDASQVGPLLDQTTGPINTVMVDGAYDGEPSYQTIAERDRLGWQRRTDYGKRSKAETAMARCKRSLGGDLQARTLPGQRAEAAIGVAVLNRMIDQARPNSVRAA